MKQEKDFIKWMYLTFPGLKRSLWLKYAINAGNAVIELVFTLLLGMMLEDAFYENDYVSFVICASVYLFLFLLHVFLKKCNFIINSKIQKIVYVGLRAHMLNKMLWTEADQLNNLTSGENMQAFDQDVENIYLCMTHSIENIVLAILKMFAIGGIISVYSVPLAFIVLFLALTIVGLTNLSRKKYQVSRNLFREKHGNYVNWANEHLRGMKDIRRNQSQNLVGKLFLEKTNEDLKAKEKIRFIELKSECLLGFVISVVTMFFWIISAIMIFRGMLTVGIFYVINKYLGNMIDNVSVIGQERMKVRNFIPGFEKIKQYCSFKREESFNGDGKDTILKSSFKELKVCDVSFAYGEKQILRNFNMTFIPGKMIVVVGANGEGKTTLMNLLLRFYKANQGTITYAERLITSFPLALWRKMIGFVQQETVIFEGSLKDNILLYAPDVNESKIWDILKLAGMYDTVMEWEDKLDTDLLKGKRLSEGQKQRIAIARILAKESEIILMDEPTAALDHEIEQTIISDIKNICRNKILIIVTHRLAVAELADYVLVMKEGTVFCHGLHKELVKQNDYYADLFHIEKENSGWRKCNEYIS